MENDFFKEIQNYRNAMPAKLLTEKLAAEQKDQHQSLLKNRLLASDESAYEEYYQQYKDSLKYVAQNHRELFVCYIFDDPDFNQIHQMIADKFNQEGIQAVRSGRGPYCGGFDFRNLK